MYGFFTERNYNGDFPYTDLACERRRADTSCEGVEYKKEIAVGGVWERIKITSDLGAKSIGRPMGIYDTLNLGRMDLLDATAKEDAKEEIARELCYIFEETGVLPVRILVVGLGNSELTPDSVGCECARTVKPTMHIKELDKDFFGALECSEIAVCTPGVMATSGLDASLTIRGICDAIMPDAVIAVDALATRAVERLGSSVQISNTGIAPGSGLGNARQPIEFGTVGVPVIAMGVPTVIDSRIFGQRDSGKDQPAMFVSPKEINEIVSTAAEIIGGGINQAFGISD